MSFQQYLSGMTHKANLTREEAAEFLGCMLDDQTLSDAAIAAALSALTEKQPTVEEVCGFVDAMQARMQHVVAPVNAIDTCGTGGDKSGTFNVSTAAALLLAGGGTPVAKHGNRAATSKCGSADVLEVLGIPINLQPEAASQQLTAHNFVFLFAPLYHPSLKRLSAVRRQLGFPTVFNLLGPLLNPAGVHRQVTGTFSLSNARLLAQVMAKMDYEHAIVLTSDDGLDEASLAAPVHLFEIKLGHIQESIIEAPDFGLEPSPVAEIQGGDAVQNAQMITDALQPNTILNPQQRIIVLNAGLGFYVSGEVDNIDEGVELARETLKTGQARAKLEELRKTV